MYYYDKYLCIIIINIYVLLFSIQNTMTADDIFNMIPDEIVTDWIFSYIDNRNKMLLSKTYYLRFHNLYYPFSYRYLIFLIKHNITICRDLLPLYQSFNINKQEKIYYEKKRFFYVYDFCIYLSKKYQNRVYLEYFRDLESKLRKIGVPNDFNGYFSKLRIKQYKKYVDHNIIWTK